MGRRMAETAALRVEHRLPAMPWRYWVLSVPGALGKRQDGEGMPSCRLPRAGGPHTLLLGLALLVRWRLFLVLPRTCRRGVAFPCGV